MNSKAELYKTKETEQIIEVSEDIPIKAVPGIIPEIADLFQAKGIVTVSQIITASDEELEKAGFTKSGVSKIRDIIAELTPQVNRPKTSSSFDDVEGISSSTARSLKEKGLNIHLIKTLPLKELDKNFGLGASAASKYKSLIQKHQNRAILTSGLSVYNDRKVDPMFTFGAKTLDKLTTIEQLNRGGVRAGDTYEFFGAFRTGKSQLCHQLCVTVQLPVGLGGIGKKAIFLDTEGTFSPSRISSMVKRFQAQLNWSKTAEEVLDDISYARIYNTDDQADLANQLLVHLSDEPDDYGLLIVDSAMAHFRAEYLGRNVLFERQQALNAHLATLARIADTYQLAVVITNQVQTNPSQFIGDPDQATGGNIMAHWATHRFYLRQGKGEQRIFQVYDSPVLPQKDALFEIKIGGII
ncbi:MAG: DNA repair and recombination protein RadA [Candidatus Kariarchaeaceae archaeon]